MVDITFETLPWAMKQVLEQLSSLNAKIDNLPALEREVDADKYVDMSEILKTVFPYWKKQTIYNKCSLGELPHSRVGGRLLFNVQECIEWRDGLIKNGRIRSSERIVREAEDFVQELKKVGRH